ncbi:uncharacterized protein EV154DRAFT_589047 [Mucor mucedo]|uniref:uncharacterized protein n=1 Tax=Mucor mucedo TaxID=29922 RepID=UPI0022200837|nr:uncharacterized protein EV154DRAFT_589047 [Mucor mucedo]KAI7890982.1 hypothetical protein EV154DRAFT_589047 [Mucor mucedo]
MVAFPGKEELQQFIRNKIKPTFCGFVTKFQTKIAEWSLEIDASTAQALHKIWVTRFNSTVRETRKDVPLKTAKFNADTWNKLFEEISVLRDFETDSRIEGQKLANKSMKNASESSLRRLEQRGLEGRNNKKEVDGVSDTTEVEYDDISSSEEGSDREEETDDNEEGSEPVDQLYNLYYKKFNKQEFDYEDKAFLKQMTKKKNCVKDKVHGLASQLLLKKTADVDDDMMLKLSLSNIVNCIHPESYEILKKTLTRKQMAAIDNVNMKLYVGLSKEDKKLLEKVLKSGGDEDDTDSMIIEILKEQLKLREAGSKNSDAYKLLNILRCIIENLEDYSEAVSELTAYRHCAKLLDCLFRGTKLKILDGEPGCLAAKEQMITVVAMDLIGNAGYMYSLEEKEGLYVANLIEELSLPTTKEAIKHVSETINTLFKFKNHLEKLVTEVAESSIVRLPASRLKGVTRLRVHHEEASCKVPRVMFSPKAKKRKLNQHTY